jgi:predicted LPLAT superfamily acyltransferase
VFGQTLIDKAAVLSGKKHGLEFDRQGMENIRAIVKEGKGGLLVSAHLGNWEVAGHLLNFYGAAINIVMWDGEDEKLKEVMARFNKERSFNIITVNESGDHIYEISAALARGELVCIHADRFRPGNRTFSYPFLGKEASFPAGPFLLGSKLRAPVTFVFAFKESDTRYQFQSTPAAVYEGRGDTGAKAMLADYVSLLEQKISTHPEQWFNYFNFWAEESDHASNR